MGFVYPWIHDKEIHGNPKDNDDNGMTTTQYIYILYVLTMAYKIIECVVLEAIGRYFANLARDSQVFLRLLPVSLHAMAAGDTSPRHNISLIPEISHRATGDADGAGDSPSMEGSPATRVGKWLIWIYHASPCSTLYFTDSPCVWWIWSNPLYIKRFNQVCNLEPAISWRRTGFRDKLAKQDINLI